MRAPAPTNKQQLKSYLGMVNYYCHCIRNLSSELVLLHELTKNNIKWSWTKQHQEAFERSKQLVVDIGVLAHYDPLKPIVVSCDASPYGVGGVLSQIIDGEERPVMFASSTLKPAEKNYSQLHREALAIIVAVRKFHKYVYGLHFTIESDHQPLKEIFHVERICQRLRQIGFRGGQFFLSMYDYTIKYKKGSQMCHADALSRLPLQESTNDDTDSINIFNLVHDLPLKIEDVFKHLQNDEVLQKVYKFVVNGWPKTVEKRYLNYYTKRVSLGTENGCLFYGERVVIPRGMVRQVLHLLNT